MAERVPATPSRRGDRSLAGGGGDDDAVHLELERRHRSVGDGGARAAVFGISDGLVSNMSLVTGIAAAHPAVAVVRLAGLAGLLGGAFSMAAGEYVSMRAQRELLERELAVERDELARHRDGELRELAHLYERRGLTPDLAGQVAAALMSDPDLALEAHAREELGIDTGELGSPTRAAAASFASFAVGALVPLLPFVVSAGGVLAVAIGSGAAALVVGATLSLFTGRRWWWSALRQLLICAVAGAATAAVGTLAGVRGG